MSLPVRVAVDFNCPETYLAIVPARALESRLGQAFDWLPFPAVTSTRPQIALSSDDRSARHFRMRTEYLANDLRRYAASRGLDLGDLTRTGDTTAASLALLWLRRCRPAAAGDLTIRVFDRIRRENAEPDAEFLESCLGSDSPGFREYMTSDGPRELASVREQLSAEGVWNVPTFLVGGEVFLGRQHLPAVERIATGGSLIPG
jgi:2-hydroxychromene-2-carboxylate isomerase